MDDHAVIGDKKSSWAVTCKQLLEINNREQGFKSYKKYNKRETKQKMEKGYTNYKIRMMYKW